MCFVSRLLLIIRPPPRSKRTATPLPYTTLFRSEIDCVITTGGTGVTGRDVTPEAFKAVMEKEIEGFGELFRMLSYAKIGASTMQSRAIGGVAGGTYLLRSEEHTSELQSLMRISYAVFCLKKKKKQHD